MMITARSRETVIAHALQSGLELCEATGWLELDEEEEKRKRA
jgi:hypothetical protein